MLKSAASEGPTRMITKTMPMSRLGSVIFSAAAFAAACAANGADPEVARRSRFYRFSAIRHAVWYAMACAGFDGRACARVTGHHGATVGKVVLGLLACVRTDDAFATAHTAAVESLRASAAAVC